METAMIEPPRVNTDQPSDRRYFFHKLSRHGIDGAPS